MKNYFKINQIMQLLGIRTPPRALRIVGTNGKGSTGDFLAQFCGDLPAAQVRKQLASASEGNAGLLEQILAKYRAGWGALFDKGLAQKSAKLAKALELRGQEFAKFCEIFGWQERKAPAGFGANLPQCKIAQNRSAKSPNFSEPAKVGHFISPHIFSVYERFRANYLSKVQIAERANACTIWLLSELARRDLRAIGELGFFEFCTILSALVLADADVCIIEAGIGARYDSTAAFSFAAELVCEISFDHAEFFENIYQITSDKCSMNGVIFAMKDNFYLQYKRAFNKNIFILPKPAGADELCAESAHYLQQNFALAKFAFERLFAQKLHKSYRCSLLARAQNINGCLLDVAHNEAAAAAFAASFGGLRLVFLALNARKQNEQIIAALAPKALAFAPLNHEAELAILRCGARGLKLEIAKKIYKLAPQICAICGSFEAARLASELD